MEVSSSPDFGYMKCAPLFRFFIGIGIGAEYPCGSVAASEQSEEPGIAKNAQHRWFALATSKWFALASCEMGSSTNARHHD